MLAPPRPDPSLPQLRVNLYSDTQTRPSRAMREAMLDAEVGDEQHGDDPTVHELCDRMAELLGKPAAMFLPSGTMCNEIAILTHCRPGDEILAHHTAHIATSEGGAPWALAGVQVNGLPGARGQFDVETLRAALRPHSRYAPPQTLVEVEQTANFGGGAIWPGTALRAVAEFAHAHGMATHMDGARLMNAAVAAGCPASEMTEGYDSVWLDFTKGLGAPLGAVLAGSSAFIDAAWRWKQRLGGALRQAGICAAACLYALDNNIERLAEDHENARILARGLAQLPGITVETPDTNLVFFDSEGAGITSSELSARLRRRGVQISEIGGYRSRACLHLDVSREDVDTALACFRTAIKEGE
ncbi:MAG: low specificity L-threonine aldolase [Acidisphaera sp.]|nr:low specificity L-threonine aldolase [Acidisphaera sp.]